MAYSNNNGGQQAKKPVTIPSIVTNNAASKFGGVVKAFVPEDLASVWRYSVDIADAGMAPKSYGGDPRKVFVGMMAGLELGFTPMQALQSITVINNQPMLWGDAALALALSSDVVEDVSEYWEGVQYEDSFKAVCVVKRKGYDRLFRYEFSVADAKEAELWSTEATIVRKNHNTGENYKAPNESPWFRYRKRMLQMRARGFCLRGACPDVLKGLRLTEEHDNYGRVVDIVAAPEDAQEAAAAGPAPSILDTLDLSSPFRASAEQSADGAVVLTVEPASGGAGGETKPEPEPEPQAPVVTDVFVEDDEDIGDVAVVEDGGPWQARIADIDRQLTLLANEPPENREAFYGIANYAEDLMPSMTQDEAAALADIIERHRQILDLA